VSGDALNRSPAMLNVDTEIRLTIFSFAVVTIVLTVILG
jgi:hypothetical protein